MKEISNLQVCHNMLGLLALCRIVHLLLYTYLKSLHTHAGIFSYSYSSSQVGAGWSNDGKYQTLCTNNDDKNTHFPAITGATKLRDGKNCSTLALVPLYVAAGSCSKFLIRVLVLNKKLIQKGRLYYIISQSDGNHVNTKAL